MPADNQRQHIIDTAVALVSEAGFDAVTVRAVAASAGIGMGTLRHYFPAQADLHVAVVEHVMDDAIDDLDIFDVALDPADRLVGCVLQFLPDEMTEGQLLDVWFGMYRHGLGPVASGMAASFLEVSTRRSRERIAGWLRQLAHEGAIEPDRVDESVLMISALVSGLCLEIITPGGAMTVRSARRIADATARGLIVRARA
ncbi:MAG: TetR/AcrR family transcriptional regulator [Microbacterium arborescens]